LKELVHFAKQVTPWQLKLAVKWVTVHSPVPYSVWAGLGLYRRGQMDNPGYALEIFEKNYNPVKAYLPDSFTVLELGPGDSLATALTATAHGAREVYLVDARADARMDIEVYNRVYDTLKPIPGLPDRFNSVDEMLRYTQATYLTQGLQSLKQIPSNTIDFVFSNVVLEHLLLDEFEAIIQELYRLQKPGGVAFHIIDLRDHLNDSLNSLRFSPRVWSLVTDKLGSYTNRLRASQILDIFRRAGYQIFEQQQTHWSEIPIPREKLHPNFQRLSDDDLRTSGLDIGVRKA
jgi:SAM-dependent methyltransferase